MAEIRQVLDKQLLTACAGFDFPSSRDSAERLRAFGDDLKGEAQAAGGWLFRDPSASRREAVRVYATGHAVFYNALGRRFAMADPEGALLHECEWVTEGNSVRLNRARMQLDCRQWIGLKPRGKTFTGHMQPPSRPDGLAPTVNDLRRQAAQAWQVPLSEVEYFYRDESFSPVGGGQYRVRLAKDVLYALPEEKGSFEQAIFISCLFAVNWSRLDIIPVVELFQSALPGSGAAAFELLWGLYDDQHRESPLPPLRYRGLPTYPSPEAFKIFSAFFTPSASPGADLFSIFMDTRRSHEIAWAHRPDPPWRYFSSQQGVCLTVQDGFLYKATLFDDAAGLPFINCARGAQPACGRQLLAGKDGIRLLEGTETLRSLPLNPAWNVSPDAGVAPAPKNEPFGWRRFFGDEQPQVDPVKVIYTVPFYPEGVGEIEESSLQPMVLDQIFYYMEATADMPEKLERAGKVLVHTFDAVISGCIDCEREREYVVLYGDAEYAQKNAQLLWSHAAARGQLDNLKRVRFLSEAGHLESAYHQSYDLIFKWIPFFYHTDQAICTSMLESVVKVLKPGGMLFLVGPRPIAGLFAHYGLTALCGDPVVDMPFFRQHLKMCPENRVHPDVTVFLVEKKTA